MNKNKNNNTMILPKPILSLKSKLLYTASSIIYRLSFHSDGTINRRLVNLADIQSRPSSTAIGGVASYDHTLDTSKNLWFRLYVPANTPSSISLPVIIYFHGGGFVSFSPAAMHYDTLCRNIARKLMCIVISVKYRLSPEHRWPAQYDDGFDVLRFLDGGEVREKISGFPVTGDLRRCFLAGDSAGGNIAHYLAIRACGTRFETVKIHGLISIQPFFGGEERMESELQLKSGAGFGMTLAMTNFFWKAFLPIGSDRDHPGANVFGPTSEDISSLDSFPPTLVVVGGVDLLRDWQRRYYDGLKRSGKEVELIEYPNVGHAFYIAPELHEFDLFIAKVGEFVQKQLQLDN